MTHRPNSTPPTIASQSFTDTQYETVEVHVLIGSLEVYKTANVWKNFKKIFDNVTAVEKVTEEGVREKAVYDLQGRKTNGMKRGLNIVRFSDGTTRKVFVK